MAFCCGKKPRADNAEPPPKVNTRSFQVGGKYRVARPVDVFDQEDLSGAKVCTLKVKEVVLVIERAEHHGKQLARIIPPATGDSRPGWLSLEGSSGCPLQHDRLDGSWEMKARYTVKNPATLRAGADLATDWVGELRPGEEVLVLELGLSYNRQTMGKPRLRALVNAGGENGLVGWLSPETAGGDNLLEPVNLLSPKVVEFSRKASVSFLLSSSTPTSSGRRQSFTAGGSVPWEVGAEYRLLEKAVARASPEPTSREQFKVAAGTLVAVNELKNDVSGCPVAYITVKEGSLEGQQGWLRCITKDGKDLIDTRDHTEYEKVIKSMRRSASSTGFEKDCVLPNTAKPSELQAELVAQQKKAFEDVCEDTDVTSHQDKAAQKGHEHHQHQEQHPTAHFGHNDEAPENEEETREETHAEAEGNEEGLSKEEEEEAKNAKALPLLLTKLQDLDDGRDERPIVEPKQELENGWIFCGCTCTKA